MTKRTAKRLGVFIAVIVFLLVLGYHYLQSQKQHHILLVSNRFAFTMNEARREAIQRGVAVSVCAVQRQLPLRCGQQTDWVNGWMMFTDEAGASKPFMQENAPLKGLMMNANVGLVTYNWTGDLLTPPLTLKVSMQGCHGRSARVLTVSADGSLFTELALC
ncbi:MAG: GspH/FimT family protein [Gammaproteobacteria bacterium]|nr:GspH/FimT family protein [Gammaproteobacteria bacterium]